MSTTHLIRADASWKPAVLSLWQNVFGDDAAFIERFFDAARFEKTCFAAVSGKTLAGMLFSLPAVLTINGEAHESRYIYAVATDPAFRGQGIMRELEAYACDIAKEEGARYTALVPAEEPLFAMYKKLGYRTAFHHYTARLPKVMKPLAAFSPCSLPAFSAQRRAKLSTRSVAFELYPSLCVFRYEDLIRRNMLVQAQTSHGNGYLVFEKQGSTLHIIESSLSNLALCEAASALCKAEDCVKITVKANTGTAVPFGMLKPLFEEKTRNLPLKIDGYMGLMLN